MRYVIAQVMSLLFSFAAFSQSLELTVYNQDFGLVKDQRYFELEQGLNRLEFTDVAKLIEPTSVYFVSLTAPESCVILEQNYEYDLMSADKLLTKYIDSPIKVITEDERMFSGTLLSFDSERLVCSSQLGLHMLERKDNIREILFEKTPEGLITRPTLVWELETNKKGKHLAEVSYLTGGINWHCEYVTVLDKSDSRLDLNGWVSLDNRSGAAYKDARLKLIAGEVRRAEPEADMLFVEASRANVQTGFNGTPQFEEKAFFEYHLYTLGRKTTIKDNQIKQISLISAQEIPIAKEFIFDLSKGDLHYQYYSDDEELKGNVRVELVFKNSKANNLGIPLPEGKLKVYKQDEAGSLQFIGEDSITHTPKDEVIRLYIGDAFDITGKRKRTDFRREHRTHSETYELQLRNHKDQPASVKVHEKLWRYSDWEIINASDEWVKRDASTIEFTVPIPKDGEKKISYTVRYSW